MADDLHAVDLRDLSGLGAFDVAAALDREIDQHRARTHRGDHLRADQLRRRTAWNESGSDHDVLFLNVLGDQGGLLRPVFFRHLLGVTAAGIVPAAVIIIGSARPYSADASITAR